MFEKFKLFKFLLVRYRFRIGTEDFDGCSMDDFVLFNDFGFRQVIRLGLFAHTQYTDLRVCFVLENVLLLIFHVSSVAFIP